MIVVSTPSATIELAGNPTPITPRYIVRNSSGGILGWYRHLRHAEQCREWFERVYARGGTTGGVEVMVCETGGMV